MNLILRNVILATFCCVLLGGCVLAAAGAGAGAGYVVGKDAEEDHDAKKAESAR